ncbi:MAG: Unknown protein [uncultured Sulfurovum sp.]|uniref:Uncharacterized protein n=1 Tax=uncultured Sulfurovum sp. TaxID=269237 RepID=A0A6S6SMV8_9BACT|nr:MAG: Unknown protein [uncultured Sulfurovum sp.]
MHEYMKLALKQSTVDNLTLYTQLLNKDINTILEEALEQYFDSEQKKLMEKNIHDDNATTNLDYDEFWDGVDI